MRARNIKPSFFKNEDLGELDPFARLLFVGLWCMADREGRLEDRPKRIKIEVLPYDSSNVEKLLEQLHALGFINRYVDDSTGKAYIEVPNFSKHQNPHKNEKASEIPSVTDCREITGEAPEKHSTNRADSLIPDSLIPDSKTLCASVAARRKDFERFWEVFGLKKGKKPAWEKSWLKITHYTPELVEQIIAAAKEEAARRPDLIAAGNSPKWAQGWIAERRWEDEDYKETGKPQPKPQRKTKMQSDMDDLDALLGGNNGKQGMDQANGGVDAQGAAVIELEKHASGHYR
jgi:hypothetical protein